MEVRQTLTRMVRERTDHLGPGTRKFLKSLSVVTVCFAVSKVFSIVATVIVARFLGAYSFGEATIVLLMAQVLSVFMLGGLQVSVMKYGSSQENPGPQVATAVYFAGFGTLLFAALTWIVREPLGALLHLTDYKIGWAIAVAIMFSAYAMLTSVYQALNLFKQRGIIEVVFAFLLLPGLATGHLLTKGDYETVLIAYALAYLVSVPIMVGKFRHLLSPRNLFADNSGEMLKYGLLSSLGSVAFIATFLVQPLQLEWARGETEVGIFRVYCQGSINTATFATTIFYTVFFPKVSVAEDRAGIWRMMTRAWMRATLPLLALFAIIQTVTILLSGEEYPFHWYQVLFFSVASTLITIQATFGQIITSQGIRGIRLGLMVSLLSGGSNLLLSWWLIPKLGITGAVLALVGNYVLTLAATVVLGLHLFRTEPPEPKDTAMVAV